MNKTLKYILFFLLIFIAIDVFSQGCSQCKLLSEQGTELEEDSFGSNINSGILYLMALPYILLLVFFRKKIFAVLKKLSKR